MGLGFREKPKTIRVFSYINVTVHILGYTLTFVKAFSLNSSKNRPPRLCYAQSKIFVNKGIDKNHGALNWGKEEGLLLYDNIEAICKKRGISIARLERESGVGNATVRGWVTAKPNVDTIGKVAAYLGVSIDELLQDKPNE